MWKWMACALLMIGTGTASANFQADATLDGLHSSGKDLKEFTSDVSMQTTDTTTGMDDTLAGKVWYQVQPNGQTRMRVDFTDKNGKPNPRERTEYLLENGWLIDRTYRTKTETRRQVLAPGQKINLLKLGEGPFPLPIGQPKEEVLKQFDVKPIEKNEVANTEAVELTPKPSSEFSRKFKYVRVWMDKTTKLPVQIETTDPNEGEVRTTKLKMTINPNPPLGDKELKMAAVENWVIVEEPMKNAPETKEPAK